MFPAKPNDLFLAKPNDPLRGLPHRTVTDFWTWAYGNINNNTIRSSLAEFIVATALGVDNEPYVGWHKYDLTYRGRGIEVKCSAYIQSWNQTRPSTIQFDIAPRKQSWDAYTNTFETSESRRAADAYVFCVFREQDRSHAHRVLETAYWDFYVLSTAALTNAFGQQRSVRLSRVEKVTDPVAFDYLKTAIDDALGFNGE